MEQNSKNIYLLANSLLKTLDQPIIQEVSSFSLESLPEYNQKNYIIIKEALLKNYNSFKRETKERLLKLISDMDTAKESLISSIPVDIKCMKIKDILDSNNKIKIGERKWKTINHSEDDSSMNIFDLKTINFKNKENEKKFEITNESYNDPYSSKKIPPISKIEADRSINILQPKIVESSKKSKKEVKLNKFPGSYRSPSPFISKSKNFGRSVLNKSSSKEKELVNLSSHKLNYLLKQNTPSRKRPWIPS